MTKFVPKPLLFGPTGALAILALPAGAAALYAALYAAWASPAAAAGDYDVLDSYLPTVVAGHAKGRSRGSGLYDAHEHRYGT